MMWKSVLKESLPLYKQYVQETDAKVRAFLEFDPTRHEMGNEIEGKEQAQVSEGKPNILAGLPIAIKDNIAVSAFNLSCASRILGNLVSPYTATAVQSLISAGAHVVGKTNLDEFAMGSTTHDSAFHSTTNPWDASKVPGGSSGGSAVAVASGMVPIALGSDTGGSVRQPASFCGIYALKPSYGSVSRYGLVSYASSLDVIGVLAESIDLLEATYRCIAGKDRHDMTSYKSTEEQKEQQERSKQLSSGSPARIGISPSFITDSDDAIHAGYNEAIERLRAEGHTMVDVEIPKPEHGLVAYYIIATAEASTNLARYDGIRYGYRSMTDNAEVLMRATRSEGFGEEVKLRILMGTYVLRSGFYDQYYVKAQRIRNMIRSMYNKVFEDVDAILLPVAPTQAYCLGDVDAFHRRIADRFTVPANLTGMPALTFPVSRQKGLPLGMQLMGHMHSEYTLCRIAQSIAGELERPPEMPSAPQWIQNKR